MTHSIAAFLHAVFSQELIVLLLAAAPISELRGAIPLALGSFNFPVSKAVLLAITGNLLPILPLLFFLEHVSRFVMRFKWGNAFLTWWFNRTRKHSEIVEKYEALGLVLFVAIPLPVTGAWTGSVAAYLLGIKKRYAFPAIAAGVFIAAGIITLIMQGVLGSLTFLVN